MKTLLAGIAKPWNLRRSLYAGAGGLLLAQGIIAGQLFAIAAGIYFFSMGLFAFGCAGGHCNTRN